MSRKFIPIDETIQEWRKDPEYIAEFEALDEEFALVRALLKARTNAHLTQEELAKKMETSQAAIARLETGKRMPSTRTLQKFAKATGTKLKVIFEPIGDIA
jgi:ribosome-binding protein aMBF1 (putative translation factor)